MSAGYCYHGCDCDECVGTAAGDCGCFTRIGAYHFSPHDESAPRP